MSVYVLAGLHCSQSVSHPCRSRQGFPRERFLFSLAQRSAIFIGQLGELHAELDLQD